MQPNASICMQLVEPIRVIHVVTEQRTGECNVIDDNHPGNRLVGLHIEKNLKLQMPLCIPLKDKTEMIRDKTLLSIVPRINSNTILLAASVAGFERNWWSDWHEYHLESFYCSVDHRRQLQKGRCMWQKIGGSEARKPRSLKSGRLKPSSLIEVYAYGAH